MKRLVFIIFILGLGWFEGHSQQVPLYSQYMMNGFLLNPAVAGSEGYTMANLTAREQWIGLPGGPSTYALSFQTRLMNSSYISRSHSVRRRRSRNKRGGNVGIGGYVFSYDNGAVNRMGVKGTYAYHIPFRYSQLSFGISIVGRQYFLDANRIKLNEDYDDLWSGNSQSIFIPDADIGVYYSHADYWAGFSVDQVFESVLKFGGDGYDQLVLERNYYLMGGYDFKVNRDVIFAPSALMKVSEAGSYQADISAKLYFNQEYWAGLTYRTLNSVVILAGASVDRFVFGYAFDIGFNSLQKHNFGTHEFTCIVKLGNNVKRYRWLNRF